MTSQRIQCHIDIALRLERGRADEYGVIPGKRQRKEETGEELRADISAKRVAAAGKLPFDREREAAPVVEGNALLVKDPVVRCQRTFREAAMPHVADGIPRNEAERDEKAQCRAGLSGIGFEPSHLWGKAAGNMEGEAVFRDLFCKMRAQQRKDADGGFDIL